MGALVTQCTHSAPISQYLAKIRGIFTAPQRVPTKGTTQILEALHITLVMDWSRKAFFDMQHFVWEVWLHGECLGLGVVQVFAKKCAQCARSARTTPLRGFH